MSTVSEGTGRYPNKHHIMIKPKAIPKVVPCRRVTYKLKDKLKSKLDEKKRYYTGNS